MTPRTLPTSVDPPARHAASCPGAAAAWPVLACGAVMLAATGPLLGRFFVDLWSRPQYEFFPLLLAAVPFVAAACLRDVPSGAVRPGKVGIGLLIWAAAWTCLAVGGLLYLRWFAPVAAWLVLAGTVWTLGGATLARALWPVGALLLLILPPPGQYDQTLLVWLRQMAVGAAGRILDLLGLPVYTHGAVIDVPGDRLMVEEACSGINSVLAVLAFTVLLAFWKRLSVWSLLLLLPAAFTFVFWANVGRITLCAVARVRWGVDLLTGTPHELLGVALFVGCMTLVFSAEHLWQAWFPSEADATLAVPAASPVDVPARRQPRWRACAAMAVAFIGLGLFVGVRTRTAWPVSRLPDAIAFRMPDTLAGWTLVTDKDHGPERAEVSGRQSRLWQYRDGPLRATLGIDYPFPGYHEATTCYLLAGWRVASSLEVPVPGGPVRHDVVMSRPPLSQGLMMYALCDEAGRWWSRPPSYAGESWPGLMLRLSRERALSLPLAQIQLLRVSYDGVGEAERGRLAELFAAAAEHFRQQTRTLAGAGR